MAPSTSQKGSSKSVVDEGQRQVSAAREPTKLETADSSNALISEIIEAEDHLRALRQQLLELNHEGTSDESSQKPLLPVYVLREISWGAADYEVEKEVLGTFVTLEDVNNKSLNHCFEILGKDGPGCEIISQWDDGGKITWRSPSHSGWTREMEISETEIFEMEVTPAGGEPFQVRSYCERTVTGHLERCERALGGPMSVADSQKLVSVNKAGNKGILNAWSSDGDIIVS